MELNDEQHIEASREQVFAALNDPEILRQCIPGCQELNKSSDTEMDAVVVLKVGPVRAKFKGAVTLSNLNPPQSYTLEGEGKGGAAGFAKGRADITLVEDGAATILKYAVKANTGGKIAQLGSRLIDGTAKKLSAEFFAKFAELVGAPKADEPAVDEMPVASAENVNEASVASDTSHDQTQGLFGNKKVIVALVILGLLVIYFFGGSK
jgi:uncharacterized protein